jgi:hypothetical protein
MTMKKKLQTRPCPTCLQLDPGPRGYVVACQLLAGHRPPCRDIDGRALTAGSYQPPLPDDCYDEDGAAADLEALDD